MKKAILIFLICCVFSSLNAQNRKADSLKYAIETYKYKDSTKVILTYQYGFALLKSDRSKGVAKFEEGVELARKIKWKIGEAQGLIYLVVHYNQDGKLNEAVEAGLNAIKIGEELQHQRVLYHAHMETAELHRLMGDFENAIYHSNKCLEIAEKTKDEEDLMQANFLLSVIYNDMKNWTMADKYLEPALKLANKRNYVAGIVSALDMKATRAFLNKQYYDAKEYYLQILDWHKNEFRPAFSSFYHSRLGVTYSALKQRDSALYFANLGLKEAKENNLRKETRDAYQALYDIYFDNKEYEKALESYTTFMSLQLEDYNMQSATEVANTRAKFQEAERKAIADKEVQRQKFIRNTMIAGFAVVLVFAIIFLIQRNKIRKGKKHSDELLLNILPEEVAAELKANGSAEAKQFDQVTVLFTDFKDFTRISEKMAPKELVEEIHTCFKAFDTIIEKHGIEKIKTIGDSYMCAGGLPLANNTHAIDVVQAGLEIQQFIIARMAERTAAGKEPFQIRIGIHTGPVVAGIVGIKKFAYDIWGDTVNTASRMESAGEVGKVNISGSTFDLVKDKFNTLHRGKIEVKGKGELDMYFVEGRI